MNMDEQDFFDDRDQQPAYFIVDSDGAAYIERALHIEKNDYQMRFDSDFEAAKLAEQEGVRLVYGLPCVDDGIYIDTPENRKVLEAYSRKHLGALSRKKQRMRKQAKKKQRTQTR